MKHPAQRHTHTEPVDYTGMTVPGLLAALGDDAHKWASAFCKIQAKHGRSIDHDVMVGWFANAIEHSWVVRTHGKTT